jgi:hypothetical protein
LVGAVAGEAAAVVLVGAAVALASFLGFLKMLLSLPLRLSSASRAVGTRHVSAVASSDKIGE